MLVYRRCLRLVVFACLALSGACTNHSTAGKTSPLGDAQGFPGMNPGEKPITRFARAGTLDLDFNHTGVAVLEDAPVAGISGALAIQSDGKTILAGQVVSEEGSKIILARFNLDGSLDHSFGDRGTVTTAVQNRAYSSVGAIAIQKDGKIIAAGWSSRGSSSTRTPHLIRYQSNGILDDSFGVGGMAITPIVKDGYQGDSFYRSMKLMEDGRIVATGTLLKEGADSDFFVARHLSSGALDSSFGTGGVAVAAVGTSYDAAASIDIQSDGKLVVAGNYCPTATYSETRSPALVRFNQNGTLDASFADNGIVRSLLGMSFSQFYSVAIQPDGKVVAAGFAISSSNSRDMLIVRYQSNGTLDSSFGRGGLVTTHANGLSRANSIAVQQDGKILAAGYSHVDPAAQTSDTYLTVVRYLPNGGVDADFGSSGVALSYVGVAGTSTMLVGLDIQPDKKIVTSGYTLVDSTPFFSLTRFNP